MGSFGSAARSSVGKKVITGVTGLALVAFAVAHLVGNLTLFLGPEPFNHYAHFLESLGHGMGIYVAEVGLAGLFLLHIVAAVSVAWNDKRGARQIQYHVSKDAGGKSRKTISSETMIFSGGLVLLFIVVHIWLFKFGSAEVGADGIKDLYSVVASNFRNLTFTAFTVVAMIMLGFHLRHGVWSAFQSLGLANDHYLPLLSRLALVLAVLLSAGFIAIGVFLHISVDPNAIVGAN
jgi:succinate dehydrogenase cytochrome b subunit